MRLLGGRHASRRSVAPSGGARCRLCSPLRQCRAVLPGPSTCRIISRSTDEDARQDRDRPRSDDRGRHATYNCREVAGVYTTKVAKRRRIRGCSATTAYRSAAKAFAVQVADLVRRQQYARGGRLGSRGARRDASVLLSGRRTPYGTAGCVFCWGRMSAPPCRFISSRRRSGFPVAKVRGPNSN